MRDVLLVLAALLAAEWSQADIEALGEEVRRRVKEKSGVELDWEIKRIGVAAPQSREDAP